MTYDRKTKTKYRILGLVGRGQFGRVYCGCHRRTGQIVALKDLDRNRFPTHQFLRELRFLLQLTHPHIVTCHALEHTQTGRYLVMDYCEGGTLRTLMETELPPLEMSLKLIADVLSGLEHAHSHGIVHCDIKPENILLQVIPGGWTARISDFGIARLSQELNQSAGNTGSPAYMAPERFYGQYSVASDLYAVGVLLFELLTSYRPFSGAPLDLMTAHLNQPVKLPPEIPNALQGVILTALQKLPARRYRSATQMLEALREAQSTLAVLRDKLRVPLALSRWKVLWREEFEATVEHLAIAPHQVYLAMGTQVGYQVYIREILSTQGVLTRRAMGVEVPQPIQQLVANQWGCWIRSDRTVFLLPHTRGGVQPQLQAIAEFTTLELMDVAQHQQWLAVIADQQLQLISGLNGTHRRTCPLKHKVEQLVILDRRHLALLATEKTGTRLEVWTRRGTRVGSWFLPVRLTQVKTTPELYRLVAIEGDRQGSLLLLDLKPFRLRRLQVDLGEIKFVSATNWGYIIANCQGEIEFLDQEGSKVGYLQIPASTSALQLEAIATFEETGLMLAVQNRGQGCIYSLDLRQLELNLVF